MVIAARHHKPKRDAGRGRQDAKSGQKRQHDAGQDIQCAGRVDGPEKGHRREYLAKSKLKEAWRTPCLLRVPHGREKP
jgi:hypothetical protein